MSYSDINLHILYYRRQTPEKNSRYLKSLTQIKCITKIMNRLFKRKQSTAKTGIKGSP